MNECYSYDMIFVRAKDKLACVNMCVELQIVNKLQIFVSTCYAILCHRRWLAKLIECSYFNHSSDFFES